MDFYYDSRKKVKGLNISQEEFMNYEEDTYDVLGSVFIRELDSIKQNGEFKIQEEECRFDLISYKHIKTTDYWWIIMEYNNYIDFDIKIGDKYKIPNPIDINRLIQKLIVKRNLSNMK